MMRLPGTHPCAGPAASAARSTRNRPCRAFSQSAGAPAAIGTESARPERQGGGEAFARAALRCGQFSKDINRSLVRCECRCYQ
eukprot:scaffold1290_cov115-Isochrysis_galbana.AAC.7